jgi:hypothetical protein
MCASVPYPPATGPFSRCIGPRANDITATRGADLQLIVPLSGPSKGQIGVRVGRLLVYVADREALGSFLDAWGKAAALADKAFGPALPLPRVDGSISAD